jgi:hypothetical protein
MIKKVLRRKVILKISEKLRRISLIFNSRKPSKKEKYPTTQQNHLLESTYISGLDKVFLKRVNKIISTAAQPIQPYKKQSP